jgi:uncharacterized repeat protein (TIGR03803 family)
LILSSNTLYGTAYDGGGSGWGTVFALNTDGTGFTTVHSFTNGADGADIYGGLILSGGTLYGTAASGGSSYNGTVFALNTNGTGFTPLHGFSATALYPDPDTNSDGVGPEAGLILSGNTLYGTALGGGRWAEGTVFALNTDGTGFTILHNFAAAALNSRSYETNSDGTFPYAGLVLSGNTLYGTASQGGSLGYGTVFAVNTNGAGFTIVYTFTNGNDGAFPYAGLILSPSGATLYGTAHYGGRAGNGTVFTVNTDGTGFATLHSFTALLGYTGYNVGTNIDGLIRMPD